MADDADPDPVVDHVPGGSTTRGRAVARRLRAADESPVAMTAASRLRRLLPGDARYGDSLSTASDQAHDLIGRELAVMSAERPSAARELSLGALQVWQALSEGVGRGHGSEEVAILFTDIVGFSSWALDAGDGAAVRLLRAAGDAQQTAVGRHRGRVVKRLGDGLMAVFAGPADAVAAALGAQAAMDVVEIDGYRPQLRAGVHLGTPRKIGGDYLGVDVNVAARVADAAKGGEVLVSDPVADRLLADGDGDALRLSRRKRLKADGAPRDLRVRSVSPVS